jgi:type 1 glutamine amidotransferase
MKNVLLTGGIYHPFAETSAALVALYAELGVESVVTENVAEAVAELQYADLFTINALRWRMENDDKYAPHRARWAFELPEAAASQIENFVESGGGLLAMHTASICFDTWYGYRQLLGGRWRWGKTFHPELGPVEVQVVAEHPVTDELSSFELADEVYHDLEVAADAEVLMEARVPGSDWQTVAWCREWGEGRVVYDALGHGSESLACTPHRRLLRQSMLWLMGEI